MEALYPWIVLLHVIGGFAFALAHGTSMAVALRLRGERDVVRVRALLDLSSGSTTLLYVSLLLLIAAGIAATFIGGLWGRAWIWSAIALLIALFAFMYVRAVPYFIALRRAAGLPYYQRGMQPAQAMDEAALTELLRSSRPVELTVVGSIGLALIVWLMVLKPF